MSSQICDIHKKCAEKKIYVTFENKRSLKNLSPELLVVRDLLKNQTARNFLTKFSFIFYLNVNFCEINNF